MQPRDESTTQSIRASDARQPWSELLIEVFKDRTRVIAEKNGITIAALVPTDVLERFEAQRHQRFKALEENWPVFDDVAPEEITEYVAEQLDEVRAGRDAPDANASPPC